MRFGKIKPCLVLAGDIYSIIIYSIVRAAARMRADEAIRGESAGRSLMRNTLAIVAVASFAVASVSALSVRGNGVLVDSVRDVQGFTGVSASSVEDISIEFGRSFELIVTLDSNLQDLFETTVRGDVLYLGFKQGSSVQGHTKLKIHIVMPALNYVSMSGAGSIRIGEGFKGRSFEAEISGSGSVSARLNVDKAKLSLSGTGSISLMGRADDLGVTVSGVGSVSARQLNALSARVSISGTGSAELSVTKSLDASISGLGSITYYGQPAIKQKISGFGRIIKG